MSLSELKASTKNATSLIANTANLNFFSTVRVCEHYKAPHKFRVMLKI